MVVIESFPKDDKEYLVLWHGAVRKNNNFLSNPLVEVLVQDMTTNDCYTMLAGVTELDILRVGTCWKNGKRTKVLSKIQGQKVVDRVFEFDLSANVPEFIDFGEKDGQYRLIPTSKFGLPYVKLKDVKSSSVFEKFNWVSYQNTKLNKLKSIDGEEVYISSLETLTGLYTPSRKEIRRQILTKSVQNIITHFISESSTNPDGSYEIKVKDPHIGSVPAVFLSYLALSPHVQSVVDWSQDSLEIADLNENGRLYVNRYPEIKPYHPKGLRFTASGIWIEEDKKFMVLRVNSVVAPEEIPVTVIKTITDYQGGNQNSEQSKFSTQKRAVRKARETYITDDEDPGRSAGNSYIVTEVDSSVSDGVLAEVYAIKEGENNQPHNFEYTQRNQEKVRASAGEEFGAQSRVAKLESQARDEVLDQFNILREIWQALNILISIPESPVKKVVCLDEFGSELNGYYRINAFNVVKRSNQQYINSSNESWLSKFGGRKILLMQVTMNDGSNRFILEQERHSKNDKFQGVYFTQAFIGGQFINEVCGYLSSDKLLTNISSIVRGKCERFLHKKGKNEKWHEKMQRLLAELPRDK